MIVSELAIEEFGKGLACHVRDWSVRECDLLPKLDRQGAGTNRLRAAAVAAGGQLPPEIVIPACVDTTVGYVLYTMDDAELLHLLFTAPHGETIDVSAVGWGEPAGWYMGIPGWRTWYSSARIDDRDDLAHIPARWGVKDDSDDPAPVLDELPMPRRAIEELGIILVRHVRDVAIQSCDLQLLPHSQTPVAKRWRAAAAHHDGKVPPEVLIPDCVDEAIFTFLRAIDLGQLPLSFTAETGETVDLVKEGRGELANRYIRQGGWRAQHTKERIGAESEL